MRQFLRELKSEWEPLKYWPSHYYNWHTAKWQMRRFIIWTNSETSKVIFQLRDSPLTLVVMVVSVLAAHLITHNVNRDDVISLLPNVLSMIITLLSVLVAAAIFITTTYRRIRTKSIEEEINLKKRTFELKLTFYEIYEKFKNNLNDTDRLVLFRAVPAAGIHSQHDYDKFKLWHEREVSELNSIDLHQYNRSVLYPYDAAVEAIASRSYYLHEGAATALRVLDEGILTDSRAADLKNKIETLQDAIEQYHSSGASQHYVPTSFAGRHLLRIVTYSLFASGAIIIALLMQSYSGDVIPLYNFNLADKSVFAAIILSVVALFLILRHVLHFIQYLRDSTSYYVESPFSSLYIHEEDELAKNPSPDQLYIY